MNNFICIEYLGSSDPVGDWWKCDCEKEVFIPDEGEKYKFCPFCGGEVKYIARNNEE